MIDPTIYDPERRFIFSNNTNEDFIGMFEGMPTPVPAGKTIELSMFKAYLFTKHLVDREMMKEGKTIEMASHESRKAYEDKFLAEITGGVDSPALASLKEKIKEEVEAEVKGKKKTVKETTTKKEVSKEFDGLE